MLTGIRRQEAGFTISELLVTMALGLSIVSAVLVGYLATYTSTVSTLAASKLNQDLSTLMSVMITELRRAGYSASITAQGNPAQNPFSAAGSTAVMVFDNMTDNNPVGPLGSGSCITYAYDLNENGVVNAEELGGFRLNNGVVQMRSSGNVANPGSCSGTGNTWLDLTDGNFLTVTTLNFDLSASECLNNREPDQVDNDGDGVVDNPEEADCYQNPPLAGSSDITVETRQILITLEGHLANDDFVRMSQAQNVRVRNDLVRMH